MGLSPLRPDACRNPNRGSCTRMNRRAGFTPLHPPHCKRRRLLPHASVGRTWKRHECRAPNPNGIPSLSPGLPSLRGYPGSTSVIVINPERVASCGARIDATPLGLGNIFHRPPRVTRSSQPWAERCYPIGVTLPCKRPAAVGCSPAHQFSGWKQGRKNGASEGI